MPVFIVRFCTNPLPAFGGAKCVKNEKFRWLSHENAELDTTACKSPLDSVRDDSYDDEITPWCPENCVLTEWAQWSACSATCIPSSVIFFEFFDVLKKILIIPQFSLKTSSTLDMMKKEARIKDMQSLYR